MSNLQGDRINESCKRTTDFHKREIKRTSI